MHAVPTRTNHTRSYTRATASDTADKMTVAPWTRALSASTAVSAAPTPDAARPG
jgi:hypothetical protein